MAKSKRITIQPPTVTAGAVRFPLSNLSGRTLHATLNDPSGAQLASSPVPAIAGVTGTFDATAAGLLAGRPPGVYELRIYRDSQMVGGVPTPGVRPATQSFTYLGTTGPTVPPPTTPAVPVALQRSSAVLTPDQVLRTLILAVQSTRQFALYKQHMDALVCRTRDGVLGSSAYPSLLGETRAWLAGMQPAVVDPSSALGGYLSAAGLLPYLQRVVDRFPDATNGPCPDIDVQRLATEPFPVELIWSYWMEEAGLVQSLNLILARFQNRHPARGEDRLSRFDLNPLRPLRQLLWAWSEDEINRLTVRHRAAEYQYEYGLSLVGRAVPNARLFVERRSRFLESFHTLLHEAHVFFEADDNTTIHADGFPVLNALRDTHLVLAEGAHNQFGDLPTEARVQMLVMQWLLAQPEMRDFLGGRPMLPYDEPWMDRVDSMRSIQGWSTTSVTHFAELATCGEQLLLSIRWGNWNSTALEGDSGRNWARDWRGVIQRYVHAYRAVTGVDLVVGIDARMPAQLLARRQVRNRVRV